MLNHAHARSATLCLSLILVAPGPAAGQFTTPVVPTVPDLFAEHSTVITDLDDEIRRIARKCPERSSDEVEMEYDGETTNTLKVTIELAAGPSNGEDRSEEPGDRPAEPSNGEDGSVEPEEGAARDTTATFSYPCGSSYEDTIVVKLAVNADELQKFSEKEKQKLKDVLEEGEELESRMRRFETTELLRRWADRAYLATKRDEMRRAWNAECRETHEHDPSAEDRCRALRTKRLTPEQSLLFGGRFPPGSRGMELWEYLVLWRRSGSLVDLIFPITGGVAKVKRLHRDTLRFQFLGNFAANIRNDQAFVLSDFISGAIGIIPFAISSAFIVTKDDSAIVDSATAVSDTMFEETDAGVDTLFVVEGVTSDLTRLVNNGGTVAARAGLPLMFSEGPNARFGTMIVKRIGLIGDLSEADRLAASGTATFEAMADLTVRNPSNSKHLGDVLLPGRIGFAWKERAIAERLVDESTFFFAQLGMGLTDDKGKLRLSVLWTVPFSDAVREQMPKFMVNFAALR